MKRAAVYRAFNADGDLLYVGVTGNLAERMKGHRSEKPWWKTEVVRVESDAPRRWRAALADERRQIKELRPRYNQRCVFRDGFAAYTLRVERDKLDRLAEIAAAEHRSLVQKLRVMIEAEIALDDEKRESAAA